VTIVPPQGGAIAIIAALLLVVIVPLWINSDRIDKTSVRQSEVQAVAERWAADAGWSVTGVTATGDQVLIEATGPNPAPGLTLLATTSTPRAGTDLKCESAWSRRPNSQYRAKAAAMILLRPIAVPGVARPLWRRREGRLAVSVVDWAAIVRGRVFSRPGS
jgi:hypothetical protein